MKRILIALVMWLQVLFIIAYTHLSKGSPAWNKWYFACDPIYIILMLSVFIYLLYKDKITFMDIHFSCISILFNIIRAFCYIGSDFFNTFKRTYGFEVIGFGIIVATVLIITSGMRHGLFKS